MTKQATAAAVNVSIRSRVLSLLHWDEFKYGQFQYDQGLQYLKDNLLGGDDTWVDELSRSKIFWKWWINQWNMRDQQFITNGVSDNLHNRVVYYKYLNSVDTLHCKPHKSVLEETYAVMMQQFIDETMKQPC